MGGISEEGGTTSKLTEEVELGFGGRPAGRRALGGREVAGTGRRRVENGGREASVEADE
jgi:hypothetical protein